MRGRAIIVKQGATTFSIMALSTNGLFVTFRIKALGKMTLSIATLSLTMLNVIMASVAFYLLLC